MDYKSIHNKVIKYIQSTSHIDRIRNRDSNDYRLSADSVYVEIHHIIPRSLGGLDSLDNLVEVLPEEHLFLHMLRYKIYKKREDALAVRFMLNGYTNKNIYKDIRNILNKKIRMGYSWLRSHSQTLRKTEGWHTPDGIKRISDSRKGTMPVKDILTGHIIGSVRTDHPNVISGQWVHHTKGRKQSQKEIDYKKINNLGQNNPNASGLQDEYFIEKGLEMFSEFGEILYWPTMLRLSKIRGFKWIKSLRSRFNGTGTKGYYSIMEQRTGVKVKPHRKQIIC